MRRFAVQADDRQPARDQYRDGGGRGQRRTAVRPVRAGVRVVGRQRRGVDEDRRRRLVLERGRVPVAVRPGRVDSVVSALTATGLPITDDRYGDLFGPCSTLPRVRLKNARDVLIPTTSPVPT